MSHHIYHTEGFVLRGESIGEANKYFRIFTKDFGMIGGVAQGVRLLKSKLRYSLQDYSYSKISLVRGKNTWRIVGAIKEKNLRDSLDDPDKFYVLAKAFSLLNRLVRGEEKNESLFHHIFSACEFLEKEDVNDFYLKNFERVLAMRILRSLGYLGESKKFDEFINSSVWGRDLIFKMDTISREAVSQINKAIKETQL